MCLFVTMRMDFLHAERSAVSFITLSSAHFLVENTTVTTPWDPFPTFASIFGVLICSNTLNRLYYFCVYLSNSLFVPKYMGNLVFLP